MDYGKVKPGGWPVFSYMVTDGVLPSILNEWSELRCFKVLETRSVEHPIGKFREIMFAVDPSIIGSWTRPDGSIAFMFAKTPNGKSFCLSCLTSPDWSQFWIHDMRISSEDEFWLQAAVLGCLAEAA